MQEQQKHEQEFEAYLAREKHLALMVRSRVKKYGENKIAVRHKPYGEWVSYTWAKFGTMIDATALGLLEWGVKEEGLVGIFANNQVEWAVSDYACFTIRAVSVPIIISLLLKTMLIWPFSPFLMSLKGPGVIMFSAAMVR